MTASQRSPQQPRERLADVIATRGGLAPPEAPFVIEHREALIFMLCEAAELEHGIMCQYLYAAFSLKQTEAEGLTAEEATATQSWRKRLSHVATQEMLHLSLVQNLLSAIGGAPHLSRPNFPQPARHYPVGVHLSLLPFGEQALRHFMFLERPEGMDISDADGLAAYGRAVPAMQAGDIVPRGQDFQTVGHLYRSIEAGIKHLTAKFGEDRLFVGPPQAQATQQHFAWPELIAVTDAASAQRAIDEILEQGEGPRGRWQEAHFGQFVQILDEYFQLTEANPAFDPVRPVVPVNVRHAERDPDAPLVTDPLTKQVMDLFNVCYEILLTMLQRFFAHTQETDAQLKTLADATVALMLRAIKPLGDLVTTLPAGPDYPGRTAGPSFELFYESDYVLPHREAAWILITERLEEAAAFCEPGAPCDPVVAGSLDAIRANLDDIAQTLAARPRRGNPPPAEVRSLISQAEHFFITGRISPHQNNTAPDDLAALLASAYRTTQAAQHTPQTLKRLVNSVLRPLAEARQPQSGKSEPGIPEPGIPEPGIPEPGTPPLSLWDLALTATTLRARLASTAPPALLEAVAALQELAAADRPDLIATLKDVQHDLPAAIETAKNGPYLVTNVPAVRSALGEPLTVPPQLALCRCGGSSLKPFCDGTHAQNGFTDAPDPKRVPDQRDTYAGQQVTIFDNRGICQHSGLCTDRLTGVFRTAKEPFVAPSGGRLDEIIRAVRDCPSGALSLAFDAQESRDLTDWHNEREPAIDITQDGPYRVTGGIPLAAPNPTASATPSPADVPRAAGSSREHYALCRCGHSQNKPFCSGMHWYVDFRDPVWAPGAEPTPFEWAGGLSALTRMTRVLYEKHVPADDLLAPLYADMPPGYPQRQAAKLAQALGAPPAPTPPAPTPPAPTPPSTTAPSSSAPAPSAPDLTEEQRSRWVTLATRAADEAKLPADPEFRAALSSYLDWSSRAPHDAVPPSWGWSPAGPPPPPAAAAADEPVTLPGPDEPVSFATHIKPLFRERDRKSMTFVFDLWSQADVQAHAADILKRLRDGTMPCDAPWPPGKTEVFARWTESGCQP